MLTGSCLCGGVAYEADASLERIVHCHCQTCRKTHGTAFSSVTAVPREKFRWLRGQELLGAFESSPGKFRRFCTRCGSHIMAERTAQPVVLLRLGCLDTRVADRPQGPYLAVRRGDVVRPEAVVTRKAGGAVMSPQDGSSEFLAFHRDELAAQALSGASPRSAHMRPFMPDQHRAFFTGLPYLFVATADAAGWPVASVLSGQPGFVQSPDPMTLRIDGGGDTEGVAAGREIGLLGLDLTNRRRNRANGHLTEVDGDGLTVCIGQSFGNCAQYIQTRQPRTAARTPAPVERFDGLDDAARALIGTADTFFVASRSRPEIGSDGGLDMSHRGGRPGFVGIHGNTLAIPDFRGNRFYNTLGNLLGEPRAGLLFIDFPSGDLLQLQGRAEIDWAPGNSGPEGAERLWRVRIDRGWRRRGAFPFDWTFGDYAPTTLRTGVW